MMMEELAKKLVPLITLIILISNPMNAWAKSPDKSGPLWAQRVSKTGKETTTLLQYYWQEVFTGKSPTVVEVVTAPNSTGPFTGFGFITMNDNPLTISPDPNSKLLGRSQGLLGSASKEEERCYIMAVTHTFDEGVYNGSSISILGRNAINEAVKEFPIVGGTGRFRMARGYAIARTHSLNSTVGFVIVGYNVTVVHY